MRNVYSASEVRELFYSRQADAVADPLNRSRKSSSRTLYAICGALWVARETFVPFAECLTENRN